MTLEQPSHNAPTEAGFHQEPVDITTSRETHARLIGVVVCFSNGSEWELTKALTHPKYQQGEPPFEARQVFECVCVCDPENLYSGVAQAVIKVKYQIKGTDHSICFYQQYVNDCQDALSTGCSSTGHKRKIKELKQAEELLYQATNPVITPNRYTLNEIRALRRLSKTRCMYTPQFLDVAVDWLMPGIDRDGMTGGFAVFVLMTKVPGEQIEHERFWSRSEEHRGEIRDAFKTALLELWSRRIDPRDCALRNLMWDEQGRKCYIVDFEDYTDLVSPMDEEDWQRCPRWEAWRMSEDLAPRK